jgi:hypothetical protein
MILGLVVVAGVALAVWRLWPAPPLPPPSDGSPQVAVPSGMEVYYEDVIQNVPGEGLVYRFRFVAPAIARAGGTVSAEDAQGDMQALCDSFALPRIPATGPQPGQIIISFSDRPVPFGQPVPEATQFFEAYRIEDGRCVWEIF